VAGAGSLLGFKVRGTGFADASEAAGPLELTLELARATDAGDPFRFRFEPQTYNARWDGGTYDGAPFPWSGEVLADLAALSRPDPDPAAAARLGGLLRSFLGQLGWPERERQLVAAAAAERAIHLTIRCAAAELYALPWELCTLQATGEHLGALPGCLLRFEWPGTETAACVPDPPSEGGRILFAWSAAGGVVPAAEHLAALRRASERAHHPFDLQRDVLPHASSAGLRAALAAEGAPVAVLHLLCHGGRLVSGTEAYGLLWDSAEPGGGVEAIDAEALRRLLRPHLGTLRLVVLAACHGASAGAPGNALGSVAQALHRLGIPAVVASRQPLSVQGSIVLTEVLYERMLVGLRSLEDAFLAARRRLSEGAGGDWAALQLYARAGDGGDHRPFVVRPFRGLLAFREEHARLFFGRQQEVDEAVHDLSLLIAAKPGGPRFLVVTGASGTGKSSIVLAGLVPALQQRDEGRWRVVTLRPRDGMAKIDAALAERGAAALLLVVDQFEEVFTDVADKDTRALFVRRLWALADGASSGVSVVATLRVDFLARCSEIQLGDGERTLEDVLYDEAHRVFVRRMKREHMREVVVRPAARVGLALDPGLAEQILRDAGDEPGALPLVEYTLDRMWEARVRVGGARWQLAWATYEALGGVAGALEKQAEAMLAGMGELQRRAARRLLVQLVDTRDDASQDTRRRVRSDRLRLGPPAEAAVFAAVLGELVRERLVVFGEDKGATKAAPIVEIAHEQLVRSWKTLRGWLADDRERLVEMAPLALWLAAARGSRAYLLVGDQLAQGRVLLGKYADELDAAERGLIERSVAAELRRHRWARLTWIAVALVAVIMGALAFWATRERAAAREAAGREASVANAARNQAWRARDAAAMSAAREVFASGDPTLTSRLLVEVADPLNTTGWLPLAYKLAGLPLSRTVLRGHTSALVLAMFTSDGQRIITAAADDGGRLWEGDASGRFMPLPGLRGVVSRDLTGRIVTRDADATARLWAVDADGGLIALAVRHDSAALLAFSGDGRRAITTARGVGEETTSAASLLVDPETVSKTARVWQLDGSRPPIELAGHTDTIAAAAFSADGQRVVTASHDRTARVWWLDGSGRVKSLAGHSDAVIDAVFSAAGDRVATVSWDGTVRVWWLDDDPKWFAHAVPEASLVRFSQDGQRVVVAGGRTPQVLWLDGSGRLAELRGHAGAVTSAAFSPDGARVVTASADLSARVWELDRRPWSVDLLGHTDVIESLAFAADGEHVVTGSRDGSARVWRLDGAGPVRELRGHPQGVVAVSLGDDAGVVTVAADGSARVWGSDGSQRVVDLGLGTAVLSAAEISADRSQVVAVSGALARVVALDGSGRVVELRGHAGAIVSVQFSPDGNSVVTASLDETARVWALNGSGAVLELRGHAAQVVSASFDGEGKRVVTASLDRTARVWALDGTGRFVALEGHTGPLVAAQFGPGGERVVTTASDGEARVWPLDALDRVTTLSSVETAQFGHRGRLLTVMIDQSVRVWELEAPGQFIELPAASVRTARLSPDGRHIVTAAADGSARVWPLDANVLKAQLRRASGECVSAAMQVTYLGESSRDAEAHFAACRADTRSTPSAD
jgi:WD40 repeat protein